MQRKKESVRKKILDAAIEEFKNSSYKDATMREISKKSGVPVGNLYRYYPGKESLFEGVVDGTYKELKALFSGYGANKMNKSSYEEQYAEFFKELVNIYMKNFDAAYTLFNSSVGTKYQGIRVELKECFQDLILNSLKSTREIKKEDEEFINFTSGLFLEGIKELIRTYRNNQEKLEDMGERFISFYLNGAKSRIKWEK